MSRAAHGMGPERAFFTGGVCARTSAGVDGEGCLAAGKGMAWILAMAGRDRNGSEYWKWSGLGFEFAGVVLLFIYFGYLVDRRWHSDPWGMIAGGAIGLIGGIYWVAKEGLRMIKDLDRSQSGDRDGSGPGSGAESSDQERSERRP